MDAYLKFRSMGEVRHVCIEFTPNLDVVRELFEERSKTFRGEIIELRAYQRRDSCISFKLDWLYRMRAERPLGSL